MILVFAWCGLKKKGGGGVFLAYIGYHRVTDLETSPVRVSKDEAPTPLPLFGLVI